MRSYPAPGPGSVVTFTCAGDSWPPPVARGVVTGSPVHDPFTGAPWIPVRVSQQRADVVRFDALIDVTDPAEDWMSRPPEEAA